MNPKTNQTTPKRTFYLVMFLMTGFVCYLVLEFGLRLYLNNKYDIPILQTKEIAYTYYYRLRDIHTAKVNNTDEVYDILILGGSVLDPDPNFRWTDINRFLEEYLQDKSDRRFKVYNAARTAMNSLDSRYKIDFLDPKVKFDAILWYHNINDIRTNNIPTKQFKKDYSHVVWYDKIAALRRSYPYIQLTVVPYYVQLAWIKVKQKLGIQQYVPDYWSLLEEWMPHGAEHKTSYTFRTSLHTVIERARRDGSLLILPTFAYREVDGANLWGEKEHVMRSLKIHNDIITETARTYAEDKQVSFLDLNGLMTINDETFYDICHFNDTGAKQFAALIGETILQSKP